jgi:RNA polymerase sigma factor (sigma-70 family)
MSPYLEDDRILLARCFAGDKKASEALIRKFSGIVYRSVQHTFIVGQAPFSHQDLEDLHNTVFLKLFENGCKKLKQYRGKNGCSLASWIRVVTVRVVLNQLRKKGPDAVAWKKKQISLEDFSEILVENSTPLAEIEKKEQRQLLEEGINKLSSRDRLFIKLHCKRGLPLEEVAEAMHISVQNVYTLKHRAIKKIKSHMASLKIRK